MALLTLLLKQFYFYFFFTIGVVLFGLPILFCGYILIVRYVKYRNVPGPPADRFLTGHMESLLECEKKHGRFRGEKYLDWVKEYGGVLRVFILHRVLVIVTDMEAIKLLLTHSKFNKSPMSYERVQFLYGERFLGQGLVTITDHERWFKKRSTVNPAFHKKSLLSLISEFNETGDAMVERLKPLADGKTSVDMLDIFGKAALDVIGKVAFGTRLGSLNGNDTPFQKAIYVTFKGLADSFRDPLVALRPSKRPFIREVRSSIKLLRDFGKKILEERLEDIKNGKEVPDDIATAVLKYLDIDGSFSLDEVVDDFITFFVAGQETTASALSFMLLLLGNNPNECQRVKEEIIESVHDHKFITNDDISNLDYTSMALKETLRLFPPGPGTTRILQEDTELAGILVPEFTTVSVFFYAVHRLEQHFPEPERFDPSRFGNGERHSFTYMPFSLGMRSCIGQNFAWIEAKVLLSKFFQNFNFELIPEQTMEIDESSTLRPKHGVKCFLTLRGTE